MRRASPAAAVASLLLLAAASAQEPPAAPVLTLAADTVLDPAVIYGGLVIAADGITVDGRGARVVGPVQRAAEAAGTIAPTNAFTGVGVRASGVSDITLRNLRVQGFELGLLAEDGMHWRIEDCDFSDNFHDPDFGWGEQGEKGGLLLRGVLDGKLLRNRANRCWDACALVRCTGLLLEGNDFSHASNTCLRLWTTNNCTIRDNDLSWGLRIAPGEVHARDSTCVLIESGSDDNRFEGNDATHGGDGFFIRVLNNWTSRRNVFVGNDASYANNNGFEAWSPENVYENNVANHCSYGFWLGASDKTVLRGNEAGWNGDPAGFHNAPESFGHGGIVFVNGPSSHTLVDGNWLHDNAGGGLVLRGDEASGGRAWRAWHWVIQRNRFEDNRWGLWMKHASFLDIGDNSFRGNREGDVHDAGDVTDVVWRDAAVAPVRPPDILWSASVPGGDVAWGDQRVVLPDGRALFEARAFNASPTGRFWYRWDLGDGRLRDGPCITGPDGEAGHLFTTPGFRRVGVTVSDGVLSSLGWIDVYVPEPSFPLPGSADPRRWTATRGEARFSRDTRSLFTSVRARITPDGEGRAELAWPAAHDAGVAVADHDTLALRLRVRNPNIPPWQGSNPVITLHEAPDRWLRLTPGRDWLGNPPDVHFRDEWMPLDVPLAGGAGWTREVGPGGPPATLNWLALAVDSWGAPPLDVWIDGLALR